MRHEVTRVGGWWVGGRSKNITVKCDDYEPTITSLSTGWDSRDLVMLSANEKKVEQAREDLFSQGNKG